jgi:hypothetical protein
MSGYSDTTDSYENDGSFSSYPSGSPLLHGFRGSPQLPPASHLYPCDLPTTQRLSKYPLPASQAPSVFRDWPATPLARNGPGVATPTPWDYSSPNQDRPHLLLAHHLGPTPVLQGLAFEKGNQLPTLEIVSSGQPPLPSATSVS